MENYNASRSLEINEAFNNAINNIANFKGRARRSEYWWIMLFVCLAYVLPFTWPLAWVLSLLTIPLTFRRLHDTGRSGWWWGISLILNVICWGLLIYGLVKLILVSGTLEEMSTSMIVYKMLNVVITYLAIFGINFLYKVLLLVFLCSDSQPDTNKYGLSPKYTPIQENAGASQNSSEYNQAE